jgi:hypothetical protein
VRGLTELDIIWLNELATGYKIRELTGVAAGERQRFSMHGAKNRLMKIYTFLGADNACHAVALAIRRGIIE